MSLSRPAPALVGQWEVGRRHRALMLRLSYGSRRRAAVAHTRLTCASRTREDRHDSNVRPRRLGNPVPSARRTGREIGKGVPRALPTELRSSGEWRVSSGEWRVRGTWVGCHPSRPALLEATQRQQQPRLSILGQRCASTSRSAADARRQRTRRAVGVAFLLHERRISPADDGPRCTARDCMCFVCCVFPDHHLSNSVRRTRRRLGVLDRWNKQNAPPGVQRRWGVSYRSRNRWRRSHSTEYALPCRSLHLLQPSTLDHFCARRRMRTPRRRAA